MSDPLTLTGTAVGIVSLGIQVCHGLVSYARSVKGRNEEIENGLKEVQSLASLFDFINRIIPSIDQIPVDTAEIRQCLKVVEAKLQKFEQLLTKLRGLPQGGNIRSKAKEVARSLAFPIHEGGLSSLRQSVQHLLDNLNLAVTTTSLNSSTSQHKIVAHIGVTVKEIESVSKDQKDKVKGLSDQLQSNAEQLRLMQQDVTDALQDVLQHLNRTEFAIRDLENDITGRLTMVDNNINSTNSATLRKLDELIQKIDLQSVATSAMAMQISQIRTTGHHAPRAQRTEHVQSYQIPGYKTPSSHTRIGVVSSATTCCCKNREKFSMSFYYTYWNFKIAFEQQGFQEHDRGCKLYKIDTPTKSKMKAQIPVKIALFSRCITLACIELVLGTSSPGVSVSLRNFVPQRRDPVRREINKLFRGNSFKDWPEERQLEHIQSIESTIRSLYRDGKSSPTNRSEGDNSHAKACAMEILRVTATYEFRSILIQSSALRKLLQFLEFLVDAAQPADEIINLPELAFWWKEDRYPSIDRMRVVIPYIIRYFGLNDPQSMINLRYIDVALSVIDNTEGLADAMGLSALGQAITSRSLEKLEYCIANHPETLTESTLNLAPIQLCVTWPEGLQRLLQTKAREVALGFTAYNYLITLAFSNGSAECVDLLMGSQCYVGSELLSDIQLCKSLQALENFASHLARQRRELHSLAQVNLGISVDLDQSQIIDEGAYLLFEALNKAGVTRISHLRVDKQYTTIFHHPGVKLDQFRVFYDNGFKNCRTRDSLGRPSVMIMRSFPWSDASGNHCSDSLAWLDEHGFMDQTPEDTFGIGINEAATGWHYIITQLLTWRMSEILIESLELSPIIERLSRSRLVDNCVCWCNSPAKGCRPIQSFWKSIPEWAKSLPLYYTRAYRENLTTHILFHRRMISTKADSEDSYGQAVELVRLLTFEALGMMHTCCSPNYCEFWGFAIINCPPGKVWDVRSNSEEQYNARILEDLMMDFAHELKAINPPRNLEGFIWGYWRRRISMLFAVNSDVLAHMKMTVDNIQTHILPERLKYYLGKDFQLIRHNTQDSVRDGKIGGDTQNQNESTDTTSGCNYCRKESRPRAGI